MVDVRRAYQDNVVRGASPLELVILLFDAAIEDMRVALTAMQGGDIEGRSNHVGHALIILQQLQGTLDFERGAGAARQFEQFYNEVRAKLLEAQIRCSTELMQQQIRNMSEVRTCWVQARRVLESNTGEMPHPVAPVTYGEDCAGSEWNA